MDDTVRGRQLRPGQTSRVHVYDVQARSSRLVFESATVLVEAPNVLPDGATLVVNGDGDLFTLPVPLAGTVSAEADLVRVPMEGVPAINNDHVVDPSGDSVVVSARDGDLYRVALPGGTDTRPAIRITDAAAVPGRRKHYLHGIAPDGSSLAVIVGETPPGGVWSTNVALVDPDSGATTFLTHDEHPDDGCVFTPDGSVLLWNTERWASVPGHSQLAALRLGGPGTTGDAPRRPTTGDAPGRPTTGDAPAAPLVPVQLTSDERVSWFPHPSPDGSHLLYLSFEPGTVGHPEDRRVELRLLPGTLAHGARIAVVPETLVAIEVGGQGTVNVPPWAPDSSWFAYCDYPIARR